MSRLRSMQDVRTLSGRVDQTFKPYKAFLRISCLEMEKARMEKEKESLQQRLGSIETRLAEMDAEQNLLLESAGKPPQRSPRAAGGAEAGEKVSEVPEGFRLRY